MDGNYWVRKHSLIVSVLEGWRLGTKGILGL
jgi:hypothetical protein